MNGGALAITGAGGNLGQRVAVRLAVRPVSVRLITRDGAKAPTTPNGDLVVNPGGYADREGMKRAFDGCRAALIVSATEAPDRVSLHESAIAAAVEAGVERIVYTSFAKAAADSTFTFARDHFATEQILRECGVPFVIARNNLYMDVLPGFVGADGVLRGPAGDGQIAPICRDDVAIALVTMLTGNGVEGETYELAGSQRLTMAKVAAEISSVCGREISYVDETVEQARESRAAFDPPDWQLEGWISTYQAIAAGELGESNTTMRDLTGRPPMRFNDFLWENPTTWFGLRPEGA